MILIAHDVSEHSTFIGRLGQLVYRASFFCKLYHTLAQNALRTTSCQPNGPHRDSEYSIVAPWRGATMKSFNYSIRAYVLFHLTIIEVYTW